MKISNLVFSLLWKYIFTAVKIQVFIFSRLWNICIIFNQYFPVFHYIVDNKQCILHIKLPSYLVVNIATLYLRGYCFQKLLLKLMAFYQGDGYLWPCWCTNNLYISHRSIYNWSYSFWKIGSMLISRFWVTSWFYSVCNILTCWVNFREKHLHEHELQLSDYII